jgi:hypothetical protein
MQQQGQGNHADMTAAYLILNLLLATRRGLIPNTLRHGFYVFIDVVLPYYCQSIIGHASRDALMSLGGTMIWQSSAALNLASTGAILSEDALGVQGLWHYLEEMTACAHASTAAYRIGRRGRGLGIFLCPKNPFRVARPG